ncbi:unnamed protein product [Sphagnum troendelagicum]|uniref:C2H2-type domain-containing protein n=1 Tax=Sphagnum troendelagicum TaxID=128251 RepID=A0ABP0TA42_9BRYO
MCTSMTAHQLHAHAAQILRLSGGCDDIHPITNAAVITLQKNSPAADSPGSGDQYSNVGDHPSHDSLQLAATPANSGGNNKRRRRPAGTPDPDAEVVALSPKTLMESDRFICEICNQGFQRDQNLQMHRRRHKVPWKLLKNTSSSRLATHKKRVYVCPELTCLHHEPQHALGDLVGIKKHFRRKHCSKKQWVCDRCSKAYAVQSDYKAHLKTCGTRGHCCDCGRVFSRVESFIQHQGSCSAAAKVQKGTNVRSGKKLSITLQQRRSTLISTRGRNGVSSTDITSPSRESSDTSIVPFAKSAGIELDNTAAARDYQLQTVQEVNPDAEAAASGDHHAALVMQRSASNKGIGEDLALMSTFPAITASLPPRQTAQDSGLAAGARMEMKSALSDLAAARRTKEQARLESTEAGNEIARAELIKHQAREQLQQASAEKAFAQHARDVAKRQKDMAETELADAKRMRERAQAEIDKSRLLHLKARSSRDDQCSPGAVNAITRLMSSPRDHHILQNSTEICQVCKSESAVGSDLTLGLHQTNRGNTPIRPSSAINASRPVPPDHKISVTQTASHEISSTSAAGLVSYPKGGESIKVRLEDATCSDKSNDGAAASLPAWGPSLVVTSHN